MLTINQVSKEEHSKYFDIEAISHIMSENKRLKEVLNSNDRVYIKNCYHLIYELKCHISLSTLIYLPYLEPSRNGCGFGGAASSMRQSRSASCSSRETGAWYFLFSEVW
jgi:hypothetical protein